MRSSRGSNIRGKWFLGLLLAFAAFLLRLVWLRKNPGELQEIPTSVPQNNPGITWGADANFTPIRQNWTGNKRLSLLPYIEAQARHETGNYKSLGSLQRNNLFGMKTPQSRSFVGQRGSNPDAYMSYSSRKQSVQDLLLWMDAKRFPLSVTGSSQYVSELAKRGYFTAPVFEYQTGVDRALREMQREGIKGFKIG